MSNVLICPKCGHAMNQHAEKLLQTEAPEQQLLAMYACSQCGNTEYRQLSNL